MAKNQIDIPLNLRIEQMNKSELIDAIAEKSGLTKVDAAKALDAVTSSITEALVKGDSVTLIGFGTFAIKERAERQGFNPKTKEPLTIAAAKLPSFKPGKAFKDAVDAKEAPKKATKKKK